MRSAFTAGVAALVVVALAVPAARSSRYAAAADTHFADAADLALATLGKRVYAGYCASFTRPNMAASLRSQLMLFLPCRPSR